jgi:hypothetical protein
MGGPGDRHPQPDLRPQTKDNDPEVGETGETGKGVRRRHGMSFLAGSLIGYVMRWRMGIREFGREPMRICMGLSGKGAQLHAGLCAGEELSFGARRLTL